MTGSSLLKNDESRSEKMTIMRESMCVVREEDCVTVWKGTRTIITWYHIHPFRE